MSTVYQTQVTAIGGRAGSAASADRRLRVEFSKPGALGGDDGTGTNPEQLFAAAYAACFLSSIRRAAARENVALTSDSNVTVKVGLAPAGSDSNGAAALDVTLSIDLPDVERATAERIAAQAHIMCPYSRATRGNIEVRVFIT